MSISDSPNLEYEITEVQPREFGAGLFLPRPQSGQLWRKMNKIMELTKQYLVSQGLRLNVDFAFDCTHDGAYDTKVKFTPEHESVKTMLMLYWNSFKED